MAQTFADCSMAESNEKETRHLEFSSSFSEEYIWCISFDTEDIDRLNSFVLCFGICAFPKACQLSPSIYYSPQDFISSG